MQKRYHNQKGFTSVVILFMAAILAFISCYILEIGMTSINVNTEKQTLDACGVLAGQQIIKTNNIQEICSSQNLNQCAELTGNTNSDISCVDLGLECNNLDECKRKILITSTYNPGSLDVTKSVEIHVNEETHEVSLVDAAVIMLLDFSGSMQGNRINQLKSAVREFVGSNYNLNYSVILYNNDIISLSNINKGLNHDQNVLSIVDNNSARGGTNFLLPLQEALKQINNTNHEAYYIMLISDGAPNEGPNPSRNFVANNIMNIDNSFCLVSTRQNPCITIFTLGVDNADLGTLRMLSGNTISQDPVNYSYTASSNQTSDAFNAIIEEIICRVGPVRSEGLLKVFNDLEILEENIDYVFDVQNKILKFYDSEPFNICTEMINDRSNITLRWGNPELYVIH